MNQVDESITRRRKICLFLQEEEEENRLPARGECSSFYSGKKHGNYQRAQPRPDLAGLIHQCILCLIIDTIIRGEMTLVVIQITQSV